MSSLKKIGEISKPSGKVALEWKIDNFFSYTEKNSEYFSSEFSILNLTWQIEVRPNGKASDNSTGWVSLFLYRVDDGVSKSIDFSFGIKSKKQFIVNKGETTWQSDNEGWGWPMFIEKSTLKQWKENVVPSGNLTIICSIIVKDEPEFDIEERKNELIADFKEMFVSKKSTDVTIKVKEKIFSAHKFILSARSPVLAAMFENEMIEKETGFVDISDCDPEAFNDFLLYLYSGEFEPEKCNFFHLYKIGDKYDVPQLKLTCANFINCSLSVENFCEIYLFGQKFNEEKILAAAQNFFNENFEEVVSLDSWVSMMEDEAQLTNYLLKALKRF